ncbi:MAG TPA: asparagine synthase (glutamine-hydrolyzing) [Anaerolineales bacterium]|nr:asparagine synthase (glutamine-hydrolyzing) [Anaerolineales bacterium]
MCGIAGFFDPSCSQPPEAIQTLAERMTDVIAHRGPDDRGSWLDPQAGIALGFRRLAIVDLSPAGHQPMLSADGRYIIIFNGEVYNYNQLRTQLISLGHTFRGHSDTEVMLAGICEWGLQAAVQRFNGMFAFALWDRRGHCLSLVRDRLGIKPLYYGWSGRVFLFGSELKALKAHPAFQGNIDRDALALYLRHNCIPTPYTIYKGFHKLLPATILTLPGDGRPGECPEPVPYWSARQVAEAGIARPFEGSDREAVEGLDSALRASIQERMVADVPLGAFLSGGIDSSAVVALMQAQSSRPIQTFTIGFHESSYDEARHAKEIACHLGTDHTQLYVTPQEAQAVIPRLPALYDEPFSDSSQIPTFLVSELARQHVTVSLSGDGGDELFGGYNRHAWTQRIMKTAGRMPAILRNLSSVVMDRIPPSAWDGLFSNRVIPTRWRVSEAGEKIRKISGILSAGSPETIYLDLVSHWKDPGAVVRGAAEPPTLVTRRETWAQVPDFTSWMMYMDLVSYLTDDILVKLDRASMGNSLESRVPYLDDHRLVEFAWRIPLHMKIRNGQGKWLLRQVLYRYVPEWMVERPKKGFGVPIDAWLRGPLRGWAEGLLDGQRLRNEGFFDPAPIQQKWQEHLAGKHNWQYLLWDILMFQSWLEASR